MADTTLVPGEGRSSLNGDELTEIVSVSAPPDIGRIVALAQKFELEMDFRVLAALEQQYGVSINPRPTDPR